MHPCKIMYILYIDFGRVSLPAAVAKPSHLSSSSFSFDRIHLPNFASGTFPPFLHTRSFSFISLFAFLIFMIFFCSDSNFRSFIAFSPST